MTEPHIAIPLPQQKTPPTSRLTWRQTSIGLVLLLAFWAALLIIFFANDFIGARPLKAGNVSPVDIRAPRRISYISNIRTERAREQAANLVADIYTPPDRSIALQQLRTAQDIANVLSNIRQSSSLTLEEKRRQIEEIEPVPFSPDAIDTILQLDETRWQRVVSEVQRILDQLYRRGVREDQVEARRREISSQISTTMSDAESLIIEEWVAALLVPNSFLDIEATENARENARQNVQPVEVHLEQGQSIVRAGEVVQPEHVEALEALGLQSSTPSRQQIASTALLLGLLVLIVGLYTARLHPYTWQQPRYLFAYLGILAGAAGLASLFLDAETALVYLVPLSAGIMVLAGVLSIDLAIVASLVMTVLVFDMTRSYELSLYTLLGSSVGALAMWQLDRLQGFVRAGLLVGLTNVATLLVFALRDTSMEQSLSMISHLGAALGNGLLSAAITLASFYVLGQFLGVTTFLQLWELSRPNHPLLRELLLTAPGTYHHSIVVGNLAERAADAIGADSLLVRVAAYYHDIGKTKNPVFFVENQTGTLNPHDELNNPWESAKIIIGHVTDGIKIARKHRLPRRIIDLIAQHHGTTMVSYFYRVAVREYGEENVNPADFTYPGPRPQSVEAAILMLADSVEAIARAEKPATADAIDDLVCSVIAQKLQEGQLVDTNLTLQDLEQIRQAFIKTLMSIYHPRIKYPKPAPRQDFINLVHVPLDELTPDAEVAHASSAR
ncbi:hypothetical protein ARMA_2090 [Ardenticatena maritima]|uniref:HD domain-containing protein n=1 Tax=Ardenticatena maritima TaxID=872965 RepID=A0A0M9UD71_9CHLR|nr:HDIG domain-containing metalloprotein [Ardenticatena maritima]KPL86972.1 hypothetical protein SE16_12960 [Ardenticatena maritima]GAP63667.1 hypothetical protein ARMA_2090 [Ardenticatena maritima]